MAWQLVRHSSCVSAESGINFCNPIDFLHQSKFFDNYTFSKKPLYNNGTSINHQTFAKEITKVTLFPILLYTYFISRGLWLHIKELNYFHKIFLNDF